jgi:hypothetical protein
VNLERKPYNHNNDEHGSLLYFRTRGPLLVLGYHINRRWRPLLEVTLYPFKDKSLGKSLSFDRGPFGGHFRIGLGMSEILIGMRR